MFVPVPAGPDEATSRQPEPEHEAIQATWRPLGRWPALLRLSWLFRVLAVLSLIAGLVLAIVGLVMALNGQALGLLYASLGFLSGMVGLTFWLAMAELILLAIAVERNTRQARDRLPKPPLAAPSNSIASEVDDKAFKVLTTGYAQEKSLPQS